MKVYQPLLLIFGVMSYMVFWVYSDSLNVMYPDQGKSFTQVFNGLLVIALLTGAFFPLKSLRGTLAAMGSVVLILLSVLTIVAGLIFAYNVRTEEFLIYFLMTALTTLIFSAAATAIGRFLIFQSELDGKELLQLFSFGLIGVLICYFANILLGSIEAIFLWIGVTTLLLLSFYLSRKEGVSVLH